MAIDVWLFMCLMAVFLSLVEYAVAYRLERARNQLAKLAQATEISSKTAFVAEPQKDEYETPPPTHKNLRTTASAMRRFSKSQVGVEAKLTPLATPPPDSVPPSLPPFVPAGNKPATGENFRVNGRVPAENATIQSLLIYLIRNLVSFSHVGPTLTRDIGIDMGPDQALENRVDHISRYVFPFTFMVAVLIYWVYYGWYASDGDLFID